MKAELEESAILHWWTGGLDDCDVFVFNVAV